MQSLQLDVEKLDEVLKYEKLIARNYLIHFVKYTYPEYQVQWFNQLLCEKLDSLYQGKITRLMVFIPPQHGKTEIVSRRFPAYVLGRNPDTKVAVCSYSSDLASKINRQVQRIIDDPKYKELFPLTTLNSKNVVTDAKGAFVRNSDEFEIVSYKGSLKAVGVGGPLTGNPVDLAIIDDPVKDAMEGQSATDRNRKWEWYCDVLSTRLHNRSKVLLTMCMTGDTNVLMADGTNKKLSNIKKGDLIATYDRGVVSTSSVKNWKNQGKDVVYKIKTMSGITVKANKRHPFLIYKNGELKWVRLKDLQKNDKMIRVGVRGKIKSVQLSNVTNKLYAKVFANLTTINQDGLLELDRHQLIQNQGELLELNKDTELVKKNIKKCLKNKVGNALYAKCHQQQTLGRTGVENFALTMTTQQVRSEGFCATIVTYLSDTVKQKRRYNQLSSICEIITDKIIGIKEVGKEVVYDIEVDKTGNFIANGIVSHNTRWHEDDLAGRILAKEQGWEVLTLPYIKEAYTYPGDIRKEGEALWPDRHSVEKANVMRANSERTFVSLMQQRPAPAEGGLFKRTWWRYWQRLPQRVDRLVLVMDCTFKGVSTSDYVVAGIFAKSGTDTYFVDMIRGKWDFPETILQLKNFLKRYPYVQEKYIEDKANGQAVIDTLKKEIVGIIPITPHESKESRAYSVSHIIESGHVYLPENSIWKESALMELSVFPNGVNDDIVDVLVHALMKLYSQSQTTGMSLAI